MIRLHDHMTGVYLRVIGRSPCFEDLSVAGITDSHRFLGSSHCGGFVGTIIAVDTATVPAMMLKNKPS